LRPRARPMVGFDAVPAVALRPMVSLALERFSRALRDRFEARLVEVVLFGSYARGEANEDSDIDVFVVVADLSDPERTEIVDLAYRIGAESEDWVGLSPLAVSAAQAGELRRNGRRLVADIAREGLKL
jgi:predicted nucleotidyltransferase